MPKDQRFKNYFFCREKEHEEIEWVRPSGFKNLSLKAPVVLINGAFDILTAPRMRLIFAARHKAGTLICGLDTDEKIKREKGKERPILTFVERAACLNFMPIDYIVPIDNKGDMNRLIQYLDPDLRVQGADYKDRPSRYDVKKMLCREGSIHTSTIIERVLSRYDNKSNSIDLEEMSKAFEIK